MPQQKKMSKFEEVRRLETLTVYKNTKQIKVSSKGFFNLVRNLSASGQLAACKIYSEYQADFEMYRMLYILKN